MGGFVSFGFGRRLHQTQGFSLWLRIMPDDIAIHIHNAYRPYRFDVLDGLAKERKAIICRFHHLIIFLDSTNRLASSIKSSWVLCDLFFNQSSISDCRKAKALFILCTGICLVDTHP